MSSSASTWAPAAARRWRSTGPGTWWPGRVPSIRLEHPHPGWAEQDPRHWIEGLDDDGPACGGRGRTRTGAGHRRRGPGGWHRGGRCGRPAPRPAILWLDRRAPRRPRTSASDGAWTPSDDARASTSTRRMAHPRSRGSADVAGTPRPPTPTSCPARSSPRGCAANGSPTRQRHRPRCCSSSPRAPGRTTWSRTSGSSHASSARSRRPMRRSAGCGPTRPRCWGCPQGCPWSRAPATSSARASARVPSIRGWYATSRAPPSRWQPRRPPPSLTRPAS